MPYCPQCNEAGHLHCADPVRCGNTKPNPRRRRMMTVDEAKSAKAEGLLVVMKAGPLRNGNELGKGSIWHLAPGPHYNGRKALCGAAPSIQWSLPWRDAQQATCPKCLKINSAT